MRGTTAFALSDIPSLLLRGRTSQRTFFALRDVSFEVGPGDLLGVVGPNGSGKTTLLKTVGRIYEPTEGSIRVEGRVVPLLYIGAGFHLDLSGRDNVFANAAILGVPRPRVRALFDSIVAFSGVEEFIDVPVKYYSSGMMVRLAFSIAVHADPDVILTDEILAVGDLAFQARSLERFQELQRQGVCGIFVSHVPAMVLQFCREALFLEHGVVRARGPAEEVVGRYMEAGERADADEGRALRLAALEVRSADGEAALRWGAPARIEAVVECREALPDAAVDLGIFGVAFAIPLAWGTSQAAVGRLDLAPGRHRFVWEIEDLVLWPGTYFAQARVRSGGTEVLPWSARRPIVVAPPEGAMKDVFLKAHAGALYPRQRWSHRPE